MSDDTGVETAARVKLETERLLLRPLAPGDENAVHALLSDMRIVRHMLFPRYERAQSEAFVRRAQEATGADGAQLVLGILERDGGELIGLCGLVMLPRFEEGEAWYLLRPDRWGRGLATEATAALVDHGFRWLSLHRITASCLPGNPASARVLEKLGFRREGELKRNLRIHGEWRDSWLYAQLAEEWLER